MTRGVPQPHAYLCLDCDHLASQHLLAEGGDLREGPYRCPCGCEQTQEGHFKPLFRVEYEAWKASRPTVEPGEDRHGE